MFELGGGEVPLEVVADVCRPGAAARRRLSTLGDAVQCRSWNHGRRAMRSGWRLSADPGGSRSGACPSRYQLAVWYSSCGSSEQATVVHSSLVLRWVKSCPTVEPAPRHSSGTGTSVEQGDAAIALVD